MTLSTEAATELVRELASALRPLRGIATDLDIDGLPWTLQVLLLRVQRSERCRSQDLADQFGVSPSVLSRQASDLVQAGLLERRADPDDGRAQRLALTADGRETAERIREARVARLRTVLPDWTDEQAEELAVSLRRLGEALRAHRTRA